MQKIYLILKPAILNICLLFSFSIAFAQNEAPATIDLQKARIIIDSLDRQFAIHFFNGDSVALYKMYAKDARFGSLKGNEILLS